MSIKQLREDALAWINSCQPTSLAEAVFLEDLRQVCERATAAEAKPPEAPRATGSEEGMDDALQYAVEKKGNKE